MAYFKIAHLSDDRISEAIEFIIKTINEEIEPDIPFNELKLFFEEIQELDDIVNYAKVYAGNKGVYYLLIYDDKIIGQGAVLKLDDKTAEIRRLYVDRKYRKTKASYSLIKKLMDYCEETNIEFIRAEIFSKERQPDVVKLCFNKGGYEIPAYKENNSNLFIEFNLKAH